MVEAIYTIEDAIRRSDFSPPPPGHEWWLYARDAFGKKTVQASPRIPIIGPPSPTPPPGPTPPSPGPTPPKPGPTPPSPPKPPPPITIMGGQILSLSKEVWDTPRTEFPKNYVQHGFLVSTIAQGPCVVTEINVNATLPSKWSYLSLYAQKRGTARRLRPDNVERDPRTGFVTNFLGIPHEPAGQTLITEQDALHLRGWTGATISKKIDGYVDIPYSSFEIVCYYLIDGTPEDIHIRITISLKRYVEELVVKHERVEVETVVKEPAPQQPEPRQEVPVQSQSCRQICKAYITVGNHVKCVDFGTVCEGEQEQLGRVHRGILRPGVYID